MEQMENSQLQFYTDYQSDINLVPLVREISWSLLNQTNFDTTLPENIKQQAYFPKLYTLCREIPLSHLMIGNTKLSPLARVLPQEISNTFKDTYVLVLLHLKSKPAHGISATHRCTNPMRVVISRCQIN